MPLSNVPEFIDRVSLAYEQDPMMRQVYSRMCALTVDGVERILRENGFLDVRLIEPLNPEAEGCFLAQDPFKPTPPSHYLLKKMRKALSIEIGVRPAAFYDFLTEFYDKDFWKIYRNSFSIRCKHGRSNCLRPSHQVFTTEAGQIIRKSDLPQRKEPSPTNYNPEYEETIRKTDEIFAILNAPRTRNEVDPTGL